MSMNFSSSTSMKNETNESSVAHLARIPSQINIVVGLFILLTGNINCIGNLIVFTCRKFRTRACSIYLINESINSLIFLDFVLFTRILYRGFGLQIVGNNSSMCKIYQFTSEFTHQVAFTFFTLATIDRFLSTQRSHLHRRWSNQLSLAYKMIPIVNFSWFLLLSHRFIFYNSSDGSCLPTMGLYERYDAYFEVIMSGFCPPIILFVLDLFIWRNVRHIVQRRRIAPTAVLGIPHFNLRQMDSQITRMILLQSCVAIPSFLPYGFQTLYTSVTRNWSKSPSQIAWENIFIELIVLMSYIFFGTSFYISFSSSHGFRRTALAALRIRPTDSISDHDNRPVQTISNRNNTTR